MTYEDLLQFVDEEELPVIGRWEDSEELMLVYPSNGDCIMTRTFQNNGWIRRNVFWKDGVVEEIFEGKEA